MSTYKARNTKLPHNTILLFCAALRTPNKKSTYKKCYSRAKIKLTKKLIKHGSFS